MNPQIILGLLAVLAFFKDTITNAFKGENGKTLKIAIIGIGGYYLYNKLKNKENRESLILNMNDNVSAQLAQRLYNAFHPLWNISWLPDGTDETEVKTVANEMGKLQNFNQVSAAYKTLFGVELSDDLSSEGVFDIFMAAYNAAKVGSYPAPVVNNPSTPTATTAIKTGDVVKVKAGYNIRQNIAPYAAVKQAKGGETYKVLNILTNFTAAGIKGTWLQVQNTNAAWYDFSYNLINLSGVTK